MMLMLTLWFLSAAASTSSTVAETVVRLDATTLAAAFGIVASLITGVLTKYHASDPVKALVNLLTSAVGGVIAAYTQDGFFEADLKTIAGAVITAWVVSIAAYLGFWKPTGVANKVGTKTAKFGIGGGKHGA